ncbi:MAG: diguanylate cyclase, partial [Gallionella sp.]|nr:diguanylate cyclase [Gallionella sp.]
MNKLRYTQKLMVLGLIYLITVTVVFSSLYTSLSKDIYSSERELEGLALIKPVSGFIRLLQQHSALESGLFSGDALMKNPREAKEIEVTAALEELERQLPADLSSGYDWREIKANWKSLRAAKFIEKTEESVAAHAAMIDRLQMFVVS